VVFPPGDRLYYRLATYDNAGAKTYSKIVAVAGRTSRWQARLYANEPGGNTVLQLDGLLQPAFVKLTDLNGKVLFSRNCDVRQWLITLPVQQLPKGVYLVSIQHGNEVRTLKVVQ
jgi:hypothetical protein